MRWARPGGRSHVHTISGGQQLTPTERGTLGAPGCLPTLRYGSLRFGRSCKEVLRRPTAPLPPSGTPRGLKVGGSLAPNQYRLVGPRLLALFHDQPRHVGTQGIGAGTRDDRDAGADTH